MALTGVAAGAIDVRGLVDQLMQIERRPLLKLQDRENQVQTRLSAYGRVKSALAALQSATNALRQPSTFAAAKATVSGEGATASVTGRAQLGTYRIAVAQLARAQSYASAGFASGTAGVGSGTLTIRSADGATVLATINVGDAGTGTLTEIRDEINAANVGVRASLINDGAQTRLVLTSAQTGVGNGFQVEASAGLSGLGLAQTQAAQDAQFTVNGLAVTSSSNTVKDKIEGLTLTLTKAPPAGSAPGTTIEAEITVALDADAVKKSVEDFVKAYNEVEKLIAELTKYDPNTKTAAVLNGESLLRQAQNGVRSIVHATMTAAAGDYTRLSEVGLEIQRDGTLKLNDAKFGDALAADSAKVTRLFAATSTVEAEQGFAVRLRTQIDAIAGVNGSLSAREEGLRASLRTLDQQQERLEARLALIEKRLIAQYSKLDALLTARQQQSLALGNALAGLPSVQQQQR
ncbi:MAG TPA: flagellar filament capping protein FliD [Burkholderiaceae bacterium]|jgi:flagellar hook-associated protein 2|nr:flagellar filament capping protein FliD [Burkholderiaceae bacterium]